MADDFLPEVGRPIQLPSLDDYQQSGIYFLHMADSIVYVGQATNMWRRIGQHIAEGTKRFDGVSCVPCTRLQLDAWERHYISQTLPIYNRCRLSKSLRRQDSAAAFLCEADPPKRSRRGSSPGRAEKRARKSAAA